LENERQELVEELKQAWKSESSLAGLEQLGVEALRLIRDEVVAHERRTYEAQRKMFEVMARTTRLLPNFFVVKTASALTPYMLAGVTEHMDAKTAAHVAKSLDPQVLGEVVLHLRASTAARVAAYQDAETLNRVIDYLHNRGFVKRLGELSDALDESLLGELVKRIQDPGRIAAVACHMHELDKLRNVTRRLDRKVLSAVRQLLEHHGQHRALAAIG
jgi:hypothetical protein